MENVEVGQNDGLENVVLYISEGLSGSELSEVPTTMPVFDQKGCMYTPHVLAMDVSQKYEVITSDQTTHNIHPLPNPLTGNIPWNESQPPGAPPPREELEGYGIYSRTVQHPSLDARLVRCSQRAIRDHRR